ncbi:MAG: hypothetical protein LBQ79_13945, partial [Deltaproteobacteria bacterium]|nr:hypothetical protein [Deltaproteobacteria bacterium]
MDPELRNRFDRTRQVGYGTAGRETPEQKEDRLAAMARDASSPVRQFRHDPRFCREGFFRLPARFVREQREEPDGELPAGARNDPEVAADSLRSPFDTGATYSGAKKRKGRKLHIAEIRTPEKKSRRGAPALNVL